MNPAHYTFSEYLDIINPDREEHPSSAYNHYRASEISYDDKLKKYPNLVRQFRRHGIQFEIREEVIDRWSFDYVKRDEDGDIARDERGLAINLTMEEKQERIHPRFKIEHACFDIDNGLLVANTEDEWGCLLIMSDPSYRKFGLGHELLADQLKTNPSRYSGGMTPAGQNCTFRAHQKIVREHLMNGGFREDYLSGILSAKQIKEVLKSVDVSISARQEKAREYLDAGASESSLHGYFHPPRKFQSSLDLSFKNQKNWLLHTDENWAVLYDKTLFSLLNDENELAFESFIEKGVIGYAYVGGVYSTTATPKLFRLHGINDQIKAFMAEVALNLDVGEPVRIFKRDMLTLKPLLEKRVTFTPIKNSSLTEAKVETPTIGNLRELNFREKCIRKEHDKFDEKWIRIQEIANQLTEPEKEKNKEDDLAFG